jgi:hypothetical protein
MIKLVEYNDGESRLQGHVEILPSENKDGTYTVTSYVEDKVFGMPWNHVDPNNLSNISFTQEKGVLKELKRMAESFKTKNAFEKMKDKGYDAL